MQGEILSIETVQKLSRLDKAIRRISLIRMDSDTSLETHKVLDEILNILLGSDEEWEKEQK